MMWQRYPMICIFGFVLALVGSPAAFAQERNLEVSAKGEEQRVALVIGNSVYQGSASLKNPGNDARAIADRMKMLGFDVILKTDATQKEINRAITLFGEKLSRGGVGLFYYAGHGMQVRGKNFLIPVDAEIGGESAVRSESVDLDLVLDQLSATRIGMVILDACRNNPFERRFRSGAGSGLAQVDAPKGVLIAYATAPGKVAADGAGKHGLYTSELLRALEEPGRRIEDVFKQVRTKVASATNDQQIPWESSSLTGDFFFARPAQIQRENGAMAETQAVGAVDPVLVELEMWKSVKDSASVEDFEEYLRHYPQGKFASLAQARIDRLKEAAQQQDPAKRHDGIWQGELETYGGLFNAPVKVDVTLAVNNGQISGSVFMYNENRTLSGRVDDEGNLVDAKLKGTFQGYTLHGKLWEAGGEGAMGWKVRIRLTKKQ